MGRVPIFVGGTGLYFMALTDGLADIPATPAEVREDARALAGRYRRRSAACAPGRARSADRRTNCGPAIRSACCAPMKCSRRRAGRWRNGRSRPAAPLLDKDRIAAFVLDMPRETLRARIATRFETMLDQGGLRGGPGAGGAGSRAARRQAAGPSAPAGAGRGPAGQGGSAGRRRHRHAAICQAPDDVVPEPDGTLYLV